MPEEIPGGQHRNLIIGVLVALVVVYLIYRTKSGQAQVIQTGGGSTDQTQVQLAQINAEVANKQLSLQALTPLAQLMLGQRQIDAQLQAAQIQSSHDIAIGTLQANVASQQIGAQEAVQAGTIAAQTQLGLAGISSQEYQTQLAAQTQQQAQTQAYQLGVGQLNLQGFIAQLSSDLQTLQAKLGFRLGQRTLSTQQTLGLASINAGQTVQLDAINKQAEVQNRQSLFGFLGSIFNAVGGLAGGFAGI